MIRRRAPLRGGTLLGSIKMTTMMTNFMPASDPALCAASEGDAVILTYHNKRRFGTIVRMERTYMVVNTLEGYRSFTYSKITDMAYRPQIGE